MLLIDCRTATHLAVGTSALDQGKFGGDIQGSGMMLEWDLLVGLRV